LGIRCFSQQLQQIRLEFTIFLSALAAPPAFLELSPQAPPCGPPLRA